MIDAVQGLSKRGMDLTYLGNGSSVLAVAGQCSQGGNIVIWDSHRPLTSGPVARLSYHMAGVTALKVPNSSFKALPSSFSLQIFPFPAYEYALWCVDEEAHLSALCSLVHLKQS